MIAEAVNVCLTISGLATFSIGLLVHRRFMRVGETSPVRVISLVIAAMEAQMLLGGIIARSPFAYVSAAGLAGALYAWWINGGGGGLSKAVKKIKGAFTLAPKLAHQGL